ncbi:MAG: glutaredoxin domain-containing protein [Pseudomonadota bacterium]
MTTITLFTKPDCPFCPKAKDFLSEAGLTFDEIDVTASTRNADLAVATSGRTSVPQVFFGTVLIGGADELQALKAAGLLQEAAATADGSLILDAIPDDELHRDAEDIPLSAAITERHPVEDAVADPDQRAILRHFRETFGFMPNSGHYQTHWPEAYKLYSYSHHFDTEQGEAKILGKPVMLATAWSTSNAHGCDYCRVHTTNMGGEAGGTQKMIKAARDGTAPEDHPIGPFELKLVDLAAAATTNTATQELIYGIHATADEARTPTATPDEAIRSTAMVAAAFGFLNVFNDIIDVDIEREWADAAEKSAGVGSGRHGVSRDRASDNLDDLDADLPEGGRTAEEVMARYDASVASRGGVESFAEAELGLSPNWVAAWPEDRRARHVLFYTEVMGDRVHSLIPSELKHLMARVAAIATGHAALAATEGFFAIRAGGGSDRAAARARACWDEAIMCHGLRTPPHGLFDERERAALTLAWLSAQAPLATPRRFLEPALRAFAPRELIELSFVCGLASMIQRFAAIAKPELDAEAEAVLRDVGIETNTIALRAPRPSPAPAQSAA